MLAELLTSSRPSADSSSRADLKVVWPHANAIWQATAAARAAHPDPLHTQGAEGARDCLGILPCAQLLQGRRSLLM